MEDKKASKMFLAVAVALGVIAMIMAFGFINSAAAPEGTAKVKIVVATHDLNPSTPLEPGHDLKVEEIPAKYAAFANRTLDPSTLTGYKGQKVNRRIPAGQPVFLSDFAAGGELIPAPGCRALSIRAACGLAATGDHVKILEFGTGVIVGTGDGFKVLAIGTNLNTTRNMVTKAEQDTAANPARLVTLEVTDVQAADIAKQLHANPENNMLLVTPPPPAAAAATQK